MPQGFQKKTISERDSLGTKLKAARTKLNYSLDDAEQETKIRKPYLEAMEADRWHELPPSHVKGFIKRYGHFLQLDASELSEDSSFLALTHERKHLFVPYSLKRERQWLITPRMLTTVLSVVVLLAFIGYVTYQVRQFSAPPSLVVTKPDSASVVTSDALTIEGKTDPGVMVTIDDLQANSDENGNFSYPVTLRPGVNNITIKAENRIKKDSFKTVSVLYQAPPATPTPSPTVTATPSPAPSASPSSSLKTSPQATAQPKK